LFAGLLHEFGGVPLEPFLALKAAKMVGFAFVGDFEFGGVFVEDHAADWVSEHLVRS
jgi:hypothetical protein